MFAQVFVYRSSRQSRLKLTSFLFSTCLLACGTNVQAQTVNLTDDVSRPIPGSGHDYIHMLGETVNPANGNVHINIDFPTPKGRGLSLPYALTYDSGEVHHFVSLVPSTGGLNLPAFYQTDLAEAGFGWSDTLPYATASVYSVPMTSSTSGEPTDLGYCPITSSYNFYDPHGVSHALGLAGIGQITGGNAAGSGALTSQSLCVNAGTIPASQSGGDDQVSAMMNDKCTGYPYIGVTVPADCVNGSPGFIVRDEYGTTYTFPANEFAGANGSGVGYTTTAKVVIGYPTQIEDRNGNIINFSTAGASSGYWPVIDTLGNQLISNTSSALIVGGLSYQLSYTPITWKFSLGSSQIQIPTSPNIPTPECGATFSSNSGEFSSKANGSKPSGIQIITLPNGQQYTFDYDSVYGLIQKITYPDGGWVTYQWGASKTVLMTAGDAYSSLATFDGNLSNAGNGIYPNGCNYQYATPVIQQRQIGYGPGSAPAQTQTFYYHTNWASGNISTGLPGWTTKTTYVTTTDNITGSSYETIYNYSYVLAPASGAAAAKQTVQYQLPVEDWIAYYDGANLVSPSSAQLGETPPGKPMEVVHKTWIDQVDMTSQSTTQDNGLVSTTTYCYNPGNCNTQTNNDLVTQKSEYGYDGKLMQSTSYAYYGDGQPSQILVTDGNGNLVAETDAYYDGYTSLQGGGTAQPVAAASTPVGPANCTTAVGTAGNCSTHDETNYGPSNGGRANLTKLVKWSNTGSTQTTTMIYDETGQVLSKTDGCGNVVCSDMRGGAQITFYSYTDNSTGGNANPGGNSNAYLTQITDPLGNTEKFSYNYVTTIPGVGNGTLGLLMSSTDENQKTTSYTYNDSLYRLTNTSYPDGGETTISYQDTVPSVTTSKLLNKSNQWLTNVSVLDGFGRMIESELTSDPSGTDYTFKSYDGEGHVYQSSNPTRCNLTIANWTTASCLEPTWGFQTNYYDLFGRPMKTIEQDGGTLQWCYNGVSSIPAVSSGVCSGHIGSMPGTWVDSTDENGNHWQRTSDALGRLTEVMEPNGSSQTPSMETDYGYDALNNLLSVTQWGGVQGSSGTRRRSFIYNSLSQLLSATNPETGTVGYSYDANGNVLTKIDARGVVTNYAYNALNQVLSKTYSNDPSGTPFSCFQYGTSPNTVERLINQWTQSPSVCAASVPSSGVLTRRSILAYDPMGRVQNEQQYTPANQSAPYALQYTYDFAGNLITSTSGAGPASPTTFTNCFDQAGRLQMLSSSFTGTTYPQSLFSAQGTAATPCLNTSSPSVAGTPYAAFGGLMNAQFGSNGLSLVRNYDPRLRITGEIDTGSSVPPATSGSATVTIVGSEQSK